MDRKKLGQKIRALRKARGWKQVDLERHSGVSERSIQDIERGKGNPSLGNLEAISSTLGVPLIGLYVEDPGLGTKKLNHAGLTSPEDLVAGLDFVSRFAGRPRDIRLAVMALVYEKPEYARQISTEFREQFSLLLTAAQK